MTDVYHRSAVTLRHEWVVPVDPGFGACWNEVQRAINQAKTKWLELNQETARINAQDDRCISVPDNEIRVKVGDDEIVVFFEQKLAPGIHQVLVGK
jgi:hypothetical protein